MSERKLHYAGVGDAKTRCGLEVGSVVSVPSDPLTVELNMIGCPDCFTLGKPVASKAAKEKRLSDTRLAKAVCAGRAIEVLSIDEVDSVVDELAALRENYKKLSLSKSYLDDDGEEYREQLEAGAVVSDLAVVASASMHAVAHEVSLARGVACDDYRQAGKLEICVCGKGLREHRRELV